LLSYFRFFFTPGGGNGQAGMGVVIVCHHDGLGGGQGLGRGFIFNLVFKGQALMTDTRRPHPNPDVLPQGNRLQVSHVDIRHDQPEVGEGNPVKQAQLQQVCKARLLDESDKVGVIDMSLGVEITITYLNRVVKVEIWHIMNYTGICTDQ
jgi:hypothetical protein